MVSLFSPMRSLYVACLTSCGELYELDRRVRRIEMEVLPVFVKTQSQISGLSAPSCSSSDPETCLEQCDQCFKAIVPAGVRDGGEIRYEFRSL
jgi:hypothetical protein